MSAPRGGGGRRWRQAPPARTRPRAAPQRRAAAAARRGAADAFHVLGARRLRCSRRHCARVPGPHSHVYLVVCPMGANFHQCRCAPRPPAARRLGACTGLHACTDAPGITLRAPPWRPPARDRADCRPLTQVVKGGPPIVFEHASQGGGRGGQQATKCARLPPAADIAACAVAAASLETRARRRRRRLDGRCTARERPCYHCHTAVARGPHYRYLTRPLGPGRPHDGGVIGRQVPHGAAPPGGRDDSGVAGTSSGSRREPGARGGRGGACGGGGRRPAARRKRARAPRSRPRGVAGAPHAQ